MSRTLDLKTRIHALNDIESIFGAMKSLAVIEMNKVGRVISRIEKMHETISAALADFESFYSRDKKRKEPALQTLCLLIGSERGFCGPFNERIIEAYREAKANGTAQKSVAVGRKLSQKLEGKFDVDLSINGPNTAEEIPAVINELGAKLLPFAGYRWMLVHNDGGSPLVSYPMEQQNKRRPDSSLERPLLNMAPKKLYPQLSEQHLFSMLNRSLYVSFMAENRERLQHMEGALNHIKNDGAELLIKLNTHRQEDITEELEILMMNFSQ